MEYKIELKKLQIIERLSEETTCFSSDLYINGKKVGYANNRGHGGPTDYFPEHGDKLEECRKIINAAEKYFESLPHEKQDFEIEPGQPVFMPRSLESEIDKIVDAAIVEKEKKKMQRKFKDHLVFGHPKGQSYFTVKFTVPIEQLIRDHKDRLVASMKNHMASPEWKEGFVFLNDNIPTELWQN